MRLLKFTLIILLLLFTSFSVCFADNPAYTIKFLSDKSKLPAKIILLDNHLTKQNRIFFFNRKYGEARNSQIVEYDLKKERIIKTLYDSENNPPIREFFFDDRNIVWSVINLVGDNYSADIYVYDNHSKNIWVMKRDIPCGNENLGLVPISLKVNNERIVWIEHSLNDQKSYIKQFNLQNNQETLVQALDFLPEAEHIKFASFFLELNGNKLFFDKRESENRIFIVRWDVRSNQQIDQWKAKGDIVLHFNGSYSPVNDYLALYGKTEKEEQIYILDFKNQKQFPIVGFRNSTFIYDDIIRTYNNNVIYTVQQNISGKIVDHYYGEIYDLDSMEMTQHKYAIDIFQNQKYIATLGFDKDGGSNVVDFKLYSLIVR